MWTSPPLSSRLDQPVSCHQLFSESSNSFSPRHSWRRLCRRHVLGDKVGGCDGGGYLGIPGVRSAHGDQQTAATPSILEHRSSISLPPHSRAYPQGSFLCHPEVPPLHQHNIAITIRFIHVISIRIIHVITLARFHMSRRQTLEGPASDISCSGCLPCQLPASSGTGY